MSASRTSHTHGSVGNGPKIVDFRGRQLDPETGTLLIAGEETNDSIFHNDRTQQPRENADRNKLMTDFMSGLGGGSGTGGRQVFLNITPHPDDEFKPPDQFPTEFKPGFRINDQNLLYRTQCAYCFAIITDKQRERGYRLSEIEQAANEGCGTCDAIQKVVRVYAEMIFQKFDHLKVMVRQSHNKPLRLLSSTKKITVVFDEYGGEAIILNFNGASLVFQTAIKTCVSANHCNLASSKATGKNETVWNTSSQEAVRKIKAWITKCSEEHPQCAIPTVSKLPLRVLDVANSRVRLIETNGEIAPYVTLSHCWGLKIITKVTTENLDSMKRDISWTSLSRTFQDAIILTWKLGYRYLWIDGLCILQDSKEDWERHASQMASIFSNSQLTISASRGADGHKGLYANRVQEPLILHSSQSREVYDETLWHNREIEGPDRDGNLTNFVARLERQHGLYRHNRPKEPLLKRAWVFQEQILSPRIIHFASGELCFECKSHVVCECTDWSLRSDSAQWETRWRKSHSWLLNRGPTHKLQARTAQQIRNDFEAYSTLIERYSELEITAEMDRLPALSGVTYGREDEYLAGMWRSLLLESLHWNAAPMTLNNVMARRPYEYRGPSWSWVSMEAPIRHFEKEFSSHQWSAFPVAKILGASCTVDGLDPRGRVTGGYLRINGPMDELKVIEIGFCNEEEPVEVVMRRITLENRPSLADPTLDPPMEPVKTVTYATIRKGTLEGRAYLDMPLALCRSEPAEVRVGDTVMGLIISSKAVLILKEVSDTPGAYRRVGYFQPTKEGWSFRNDRGSVFIL